MGLSLDAVQRLFGEGDIIALRMQESNTPKNYYFKVQSQERPNNLADFSLGSAVAQATAGTGWSEIQDSQSRNLLEPESEDTIFHIFYGIDPVTAQVYRRFPGNVDHGSLRGTRDVSGDVGYIDGWSSPYYYPSAVTEFFNIKGLNPNFNGYHPYTEPGSITVRMFFYVARYLVDYLKQPTEAEKARAAVRTMGGVPLASAPEFLR